jgi:hypothetical protein
MNGVYKRKISIKRLSWGSFANKIKAFGGLKVGVLRKQDRLFSLDLLRV